MEKRNIYVDNAATTAVSDAVLDSMLPYFKNEYGNPSSIYSLGQNSAKAILKAREDVASCIGAKTAEIFFTSGGSESDNWAIKGVAQLGKESEKMHIITSAFEHHAVLHVCQDLEKNGFKVTYLPISKDGFVDVNDVKNAITNETCLVSIMAANNEIGTIQPIAEIGRVCKENGVYFHTDAVQAIGNIEIDVKKMNIDLLSLSGHKIHAPKGVGALYARNGIRLPNLIHGGGQERSRRAGTENVPSIVGLATAIKIATANVQEKIEKLEPLRDRLIAEILKLPKTQLNGGQKNRLCSNLNISIQGIEGESLLLSLDFAGISASSGSACTSGSLDPSHVLLALGLKHEIAHGSLRISLSESTTEADVDYILEKLPPIVERLRNMSPLWEKICNE